MRFRRPRSARSRAAALAAAGTCVALAGCGEVTNTIQPQPGTVNQVQVVLPSAPNALYIGIYEAQALGYFRQSDMNVHVVSAGASQNPVEMVHDGSALIGIASQPTVLLQRNEDEPVVSVAALVQGPLSAITVTAPKPAPSGGSPVGTGTATTTTPATTTAPGTTTTPGATTTPATNTTAAAATTTTTTAATSTTTATTTTTLSEPDAPLWPAALQQAIAQPGVPTYDGLVVVVRKGTIVDHAPLIRRFVQTVARGYRAARANPTAAIANLIKAVPALAPQQALQLATLNAAMPYLFPSGGKVWGWQYEARWNTFGTWMTTNHFLSNPNAVTDASTNELLQGQGV